MVNQSGKEGETPPRVGDPNIYETERLLGEYLALHFGNPSDVLSFPFGPGDALGFPARSVRENLASVPSGARALDIGCAVGGASLELSRSCAEVVGLDYSQSFIRAAQEFCAGARRRLSLREEGQLEREIELALPEGTHPERVRFLVGDALALPELGVFDVVLAANVLCRVGEPRRLLAQLPGLVRPGGQLLLTTPCTWMEEFTPVGNWLGGFVENGRPVSTLDSLDRLLGDDFRRESVRDMPFLIREHARKFQWGVAQATRWRRL